MSNSPKNLHNKINCLHLLSTHVIGNICISTYIVRIPWWLRRQSVCLQCRRPWFNPWVRKISQRRKWQPTPVFFPGTAHGGRSLVGYSPWGRKELDTTERLHFHFFTCIVLYLYIKYEQIQVYVTSQLFDIHKYFQVTKS